MKLKYCTAMCVAALLSSVATANDDIELYGQIAISMYSYAEEGKDTVNRLDNESRIGFRGAKELARAPTLIWQIEGNNVGSGENSGDGQLGLRDTYGGFEDESWGRVRFGRFLTPAYAIIDWPYSNPGLGNVFDWGDDIAGGAYYDRQSDQISWDSPSWNGFTMTLATGRGNNLENSSSNFYGASAHYRTGPLQLHAGYEYGTDRLVELEDEATGSLMTANSDYETYIAGFELYFDNGIGLFGAYKVMSAEYADYNNGTAEVGSIEGLIGKKQDQTSYSIGALYDIGHWQFKVGYSANSDLEIDNRKVSGTADNVLSGQAIYFLDDPALLYFRVKTMEINESDITEVRLGVEYYF
ncbi:porin (plasmid) [Photobacterium sp. DA100]|uniref:porin n=1 Tax=Photobacterium sp. DA100 TaxID=3027472 RepID=UPI0024797B0B|nr:porin [Photobacterium sp. DA100]WEM44527.1 porin [Photobacterium sp. DA100]